ncbi:hypothetical protein Desdi_0398 [Desulfitobacterium dichloroeliminans LMG P-21439]|uniref:Uncharacterized protein n=1 Tax=Desulfitobacterium dichloroeliminans (strain LMG P-21439 / DCA1) TaxID=871963 RepID=L0F266_DESDL|nr:hypothetical protein [Desulfitobacterium dichloroeliminans]AGA67944.1 hypothetical protein Desdi_0398 [Desulfitobacterium dichloroeliminans LMG P-21439]
MKEKEIRLTPEEIDYLLKGTIDWEDLSARTERPLRRTIDLAVPKNVSGSLSHEAWVRSEQSARDDNERDDGNDQDDEVDQLPFWSGTKVYILLSVMGCITLGTWVYFVFA